MGAGVGDQVVDAVLFFLLVGGGKGLAVVGKVLADLDFFDEKDLKFIGVSGLVAGFFVEFVGCNDLLADVVFADLE